jgi:radical SAM protein with 4Fe4S-binding SPASM domain
LAGQKTIQNFFLDARQWRELMEYIKNRRRDKNNMPIASYCDEGFLGPDLEGEVRNQLFYCWAGIRVGGILFNGDIAACPILPREHVSQGNVRQERFSRVWNDKYKMFRDRTWRKCGDCEDCAFWELCEGNSLHLWNFDEKKLMRCNYELMNDKDADLP